MNKKKKSVNLALQGGGSHGAFTWGVLDRLLEEKNLDFPAVSGTSAGAINATILVYGLLTGGNEKTRELLEAFWSKNAEMGAYSPFQPTFLDKLSGPGNIDNNPIFALGNLLTPILSPYQCNPFNYNPLNDLIKDIVDFEAIQKNDKIKLYLSATNIRTSKVKVFENKEITIQTIMASSCLPQVFQAINIDNENYWDGGYIANPAMFPLFKDTDCKDLMVVQIDSTNLEKLPKTAFEILDRTTSISFNSSLMREVRAIEFVNNIVDKGFDDNGNLKKINIHLIEAGELMNKLNMSSKVNATWEFISFLKERGREEADKWLNENYDKIGVETSCDVQKHFF